MQCNEVGQQLLQAVARKEGLHTLSAELQSHLAHCAGCREYAEDLQYRDLMADLPAPAPREGFAEQALEHAWAAREGRRRTSPSWLTGTGVALATAAALVLALGVTLRLPGPVTSPTTTDTPGQVVEVAPQTVRQVDLLMVSAEALPDARITLQMGDNVVLDGYPDLDTIHWDAPIAAGNNQLSLPVRLRGESSGSIVVEVESGGLTKQMLLTVDAMEQNSQQVAMI